MSEQKRATLTTLGTSKKDKKVKEPRRTVRLKVNLSESNEKTCPEYNYVDLLNSVERRRKKKDDISHAHPTANGLGDLDPFADDDEEKLKEIARSFEERYGPTIAKKKNKKREDYLDIGAGYDETDPFIDNTDAYDEIVPEEMTTAHGGFYINSGALEYKRVEHVSDISDAEEIKNNKSKKKCKKILISDDEEEDEEDEDDDEEEEEDLEEKEETEEKKSKVKEPEEDINVSNKRKLVAKESEPVIKKKRKTIDGLVKKKSMTVKDMLKEKRETEKTEVKPTAAVITTPTPAPSTIPVVETTNTVTNSSVSPAEPKKSPTTSITDVIESVISAARGQEESSSSSSSSLTKSHSDSSESSDEEDSKEGSEKEKQQPQKEEVKLPDNLPEDLRCIIVLLKNAATTSAEGKCKFFSPEVNKLLLRIERFSKTIGVTNRNLVYSHLASYVPCTKDTLMKRAKKLVIESEEEKLKEPIQRLKAVIDKMMPSVIEKHTKDCQKVAEENPQIYWELYRYYWGLEDSSVAANAGNDAKNSADGKKAKSGIPLRVFPWNEEVRSLLCEIVKIKLLSYELSNPKKESAKDYLKQFFESELKTLWPPGWMKTIILYRESRSVHCNTMTKPRKPSTGTKKSNTTQPTNLTKAASTSISAPKPNMLTSSSATTAHPSSPLVSTATITPVPPASSPTPATASSNISPSVSIIKCATSQTTTPSQRASSPSSRATITSVSSGPRVSSPLLTTPSSSNKSKNANNGDLDTTKVSVRTKQCSENVRESVVTKNPVMLPQVHLPDCISVTPAHSMPAPTNKNPSTPIMSLKQRILQDAAAASNSKQSPEGTIDGKSPPKGGNDDCEVLLLSEKREGKLNITQVRHGASHQPKSHPISVGHRPELGAPTRGDIDKDILKKDGRNISVPRTSPPKEDKVSEGRMADETVTATDVLSQIINSSLGGFPNASTIAKGGPGAESFRRELHGERHPGMLSRQSVQIDHEVKEKAKDSIRASQNSRIDSMAAVNDTEESVQLEVDRVMKELRELNEFTGDSTESETDKHGNHFRPNDNKSSSSMPSHMLSSSVSVIAINSASSKHHTANLPTKVNSSGVPNTSQSPIGAATLSKRSSSMPFSGAANPNPSNKSYGFQDEFQRHVMQDCGKALMDVDGALYMGNKDGERNRTSNYNSLYQSIPQSSPTGLDRNQGLHNASVDGSNDLNRVSMSITQLKNSGRHKLHSPLNAHQFIRHSLPTHNSSEMESSPNVNFSGNCFKPRVSSQQFPRPELLTQSTNSQLGQFGNIVKHSNLLASSLPQYQGMKPYPMRPDSSSPPGGAPHSTKY